MNISTVRVFGAVLGIALLPLGSARAMQTPEPVSITPERTDEQGFGQSIAFSGDRMSVGAPMTDERSGKIHIFRQQGSSWTPEAVLGAGHLGEAGARLGSAVSIDGNVAIAGAPWHDVGYPDWFNGGSAFLYRFNGSSWIVAQQIAAETPSENLGTSVLIRGDTAFIGAPGTQIGDQSSVGSVHVFHFDVRSLNPVQELRASDSGPARFGTAIAAFGNWLLVGAPTRDRGVVHVFRYDGSSWIERQRLFPRGESRSPRFGSAVAISGDRAMVGAPFEAVPEESSGSVYAYRWNGTSWVETDKFTRPGEFGTSIALHGRSALIGAPSRPPRGSAHLFRLGGEGWVEREELVAPTPSNATFGTSVALDRSRAAVGTPRYAGRVHLYEQPPADLAPEIACRAGDVHAGNGEPVDILSVNGSSGLEAERRLVLDPFEPLRIRVDEPPSMPDGPAPFVLYFHRGAPSPPSVRVLPQDLGTICHPIPWTDATPENLLRITNNLGHPLRLGESDFPSDPAPTVVADRPGGVGRGISVFLQGIILDEGAPNGQGAVTNGILVEFWSE